MKYTFTINTDASFDPATGTAAWAFWIRSKDHLIKDSGLFPRKVDNSSVAELLALEKALRRVDREVFTRRTVKLYINTDSKWVIDALQGKVKNSKQLMLIKAVLHSTQGYELELRHVKAHTHTNTARHWVNDWCDKQAKKILRTELGR